MGPFSHEFGVVDHVITISNGKLSFCSRLHSYFTSKRCALRSNHVARQRSILVCWIVIRVSGEIQLAECGTVTAEVDAVLAFSELLLEASHCCQFATLVSEINVGGLGEILDLIWSQEFVKSEFLLRVFVALSLSVDCWRYLSLCTKGENGLWWQLFEVIN